MSAAATATSSPDALTFVQSESKAVGVRGSLIERMRDNAPRIVGLMKIGMDVTVALSGNPWWIGYACFAITGRLISIAWGSKKHQDKLGEEKAEGKHQKLLGHSLRENDRKILFPRKYPVEAAAGFSIIAESFGLGFGISQFAAGATGYTAVITELIALWSYGNIVFHKEKKQGEEPQENRKSESLGFTNSSSKTVGVTGRLRRATKDNPVFVSSMANLLIGVLMVGGGIIEGYGIAYVAAGVLGMLANLTQALLVRKNEFNIEGAGEAKEDKTKAPSTNFQERIASARNRNDDLGLQPA